MAVTSSQNDVESRFAYLLQPIRDLAKNWDIDLASQLEDYLAEIERITITFDGGATTMNFAEAALLIQSSACIYSRKVEYLYSLVCQVLDTLGSNKKQQQTPSTGDSEVNNFSEDVEEYLTLDDIREQNNIILRNDDDNSSNNLDVIPPTPGILLPIDDAVRTSTPLVSRKGEVLASRSDFKMNTVIIHGQSGTVLLDRSFTPLVLACHSVTGAAGVMSRQLNEVVSAAATACDVDSNHLIDEGCPADDSCTSDVEAMDCENFGNVNDDQPATPMAARNIVTRHTAVRSQVVPRRPTAKLQTSYEDFWEICDPHQADLSSVVKPFKTGKVFSLPDKVCRTQVDEKRRKRKIPLASVLKSTLISLAEFCNKEYFSRMSRIPSNPLKALNFPDFEQLYWKEVKRQKDCRRLIHRVQVPPAEVQRSLYENDEPEPRFTAEDDIVDDDGDNDNEGFQIPDDVFCNADGIAPPNIDVNGLSDDLCNVEIISSYEEHVRRHVEGFLASAQRFAQDTDLARRVAEWQDKIQPRLNMEDERRPFDIHLYGREMLDRLHSLGADKQPVLFHRTVNKMPAHEVCRYFLASLQLANDRNVEIGCDGRDSFNSSVDKATLKLLSRRQHCESITTYQAPSLQT